jgi:hypothetical protein
MKPPRLWLVWLVVVMGVIIQTRSTLAGPRQVLVMPSEAPDEASSEPEPGPVPIWIRTRIPVDRLLMMVCWVEPPSKRAARSCKVALHSPTPPTSPRQGGHK